MIRAANIIFVQKDSLQSEINELKILVPKKDSLINLYRNLADIDSTSKKILNKRIEILKSANKYKDQEILKTKRNCKRVLTGTGIAYVIIILAIIF